MIPKITKGNEFRGTLLYVFRMRTKDKDVERNLVQQVAGSIWEDDIRELIRQFEETRNEKPDAKAPVWHCSLSVRKEEGRLGTHKWQEIAESFIQGKEMNFPEGLSWVAVWHGDKAHDHIHIVVSRIAYGKVWDAKRDMIRANWATSRLEREFNLLPTEKNRNNSNKKISDGDYQKAARRGDYPERRRLQLIIDTALERPTSYVDFLNFLALNGVKVRENRASTGKLNGLSFDINGIHFKGSQLGKNEYSLSQLIRRGGLYGYENHMGGNGQKSYERNRDTTTPGSASEEKGATLSSLIHHGGSEGSSWYGRDLEGVHGGLKANRFDIVSDDEESREASLGLHRLIWGDNETDTDYDRLGKQSSGNVDRIHAGTHRQAGLNTESPSGQGGNNHISDLGSDETDNISRESPKTDVRDTGSKGNNHEKNPLHNYDPIIAPHSSDDRGYRHKTGVPITETNGKQPQQKVGKNNPCKDCPTPDNCDFCSYKHLRKKRKVLQEGSGHTI